MKLGICFVIPLEAAGKVDTGEIEGGALEAEVSSEMNEVDTELVSSDVGIIAIVVELWVTPESLGKSDIKSVDIFSVEGEKLAVVSVFNVKPLSVVTSVSRDPVVTVDINDAEMVFTSVR